MGVAIGNMIQPFVNREFHMKIFLYTLRFVQFGHTGKRDRWIDYRVLKRRPKNGSKQGSHRLLGSPCLQSHDRRSASWKVTSQRRWLQQRWRRVVENVVHSERRACVVKSTSEFWKQRKGEGDQLPGKETQLKKDLVRIVSLCYSSTTALRQQQQQQQSLLYSYLPQKSYKTERN